jgi:hypothetical protein
MNRTGFGRGSALTRPVEPGLVVRSFGTLPSGQGSDRYDSLPLVRPSICICSPNNRRVRYLREPTPPAVVSGHNRSTPPTGQSRVAKPLPTTRDNPHKPRPRRDLRTRIRRSGDRIFSDAPRGTPPQGGVLCRGPGEGDGRPVPITPDPRTGHVSHFRASRGSLGHAPPRAAPGRAPSRRGRRSCGPGGY